uniref:Uncharacterized protein n=1 Tax=Alexandrium catenella TaxID=2925 RepID=A0A7S1PNG7_ALECA|mmetsp:Transcript_106501/g.283271  ORF Transcript_106501/g.283271 Transcript_106501/m.283271 type:complete len:719 (+) Transcript_106501:92-2248(+)
MQSLSAFPLSLLLLAACLPATEAARARAAAQVDPLSKVVQLLDSLTSKIQKEGEAEEKAYKEFVEWCEDASRNKGFEIKTATAKKEDLEAAMTKSSGDSTAASSKIEELAAGIASGEGDLKAATAVREKEAADFASNDAELLDVIDTVGRAITVLEREMAKNPAAFAQLSSSNLRGLLGSLNAVIDAASFSSADKQKLLGLVQAKEGAEADDEDFGAPAAATYKSHSSNIIEVLEDMKEKAEEQLSDLRKAETSAKHNYAMLKQSLEDQKAADTKDFQEQKLAKSAADESQATAQGDLATTVKDLADSKSALDMANSNCMQTAADHEATVKAREEELKVIAEAKEVLSKSTSGAVSQTYSLLAVESHTVSSLRTRADLANAEVINLVKKLAKEQHSAALAQLASRISAVMRFGAGAGEDPFAKVKGLVQDLIAKLQAEAGSEATEKAYCDEQLAKTEEKKGELGFDISKLTAKIDQAAAKSASLKGEVKQLQEELAILAKEQADMDAVRREAHAAFVQAKADLEQGLTGVRKALSVLREYYGGAAAAAMLQSTGASADDQPAMPEQHSKATGAGSSIVGLLEVIESDFAKNLAAEDTAEDSAAVEYEKMSQQNKVTNTLKTQDVKYKTKESNSLDKNIADLTADRDTSDAELSAVLEYYAKVKERCIAKPETYEARKQRRVAEIKGLKEALTILEDEVALMQRGKRGLRNHFLGLNGQ